jgi:nucleotide-binding universal stress UspA family protein
MQSLIVAVDGSEKSLDGVKMGASLAKSMGLKLELAYVQPPILLPPSVYGETIKKIEAANLKLSEEIFAKATELARAAGLEPEKIPLTGAPAEALADLSLDDRVWAVVIAAKGHNAVSRVMLGSVADRLVHLCHKPVLVVR